MHYLHAVGLSVAIRNSLQREEGRVEEIEETVMRFFRALRRRRRQPTPPFYVLELDLPFDEVLADLVYPAPSAA
jgi:hypothetical protein